MPQRADGYQASSGFTPDATISDSDNTTGYQRGPTALSTLGITGKLDLGVSPPSVKYCKFYTKFANTLNFLWEYSTDNVSWSTPTFNLGGSPGDNGCVYTGSEVDRTIHTGTITARYWRLSVSDNLGGCPTVQIGLMEMWLEDSTGTRILEGTSVLYTLTDPSGASDNVQPVASPGAIDSLQGIDGYGVGSTTILTDTLSGFDILGMVLSLIDSLPAIMDGAQFLANVFFPVYDLLTVVDSSISVGTPGITDSLDAGDISLTIYLLSDNFSNVIDNPIVPSSYTFIDSASGAELLSINVVPVVLTDTINALDSSIGLGFPGALQDVIGFPANDVLVISNALILLDLVVGSEILLPPPIYKLVDRTITEIDGNAAITSNIVILDGVAISDGGSQVTYLFIDALGSADTLQYSMPTPTLIDGVREQYAGNVSISILWTDPITNVKDVLQTLTTAAVADPLNVGDVDAISPLTLLLDDPTTLIDTPGLPIVKNIIDAIGFADTLQIPTLIIPYIDTLLTGEGVTATVQGPQVLLDEGDVLESSGIVTGPQRLAEIVVENDMFETITVTNIQDMMIAQPGVLVITLPAQLVQEVLGVLETLSVSGQILMTDPVAETDLATIITPTGYLADVATAHDVLKDIFVSGVRGGVTLTKAYSGRRY